MTDRDATGVRAGTARSAGTVLAGRYRLRAVLSRRLGSVLWRSTDEVLGREVSVLVVDAGDPRAQPVLAAARRAATASDQHFLRVYDAAVDPGAGEPVVFVVQEWVSGRSLTNLLAGGPIDPQRAALLTRELAEAVAAVHDAGLTHRVLTPDRVLVSANGAVRVVGLEVAAALAGVPATGTPADREADVRALGAVLYAGLTGRWPLAAADAGPADSVYRIRGEPRRDALLPPAPHRHGRVLGPRQVRPGIPRNLDLLALRALGRTPAGRPVTSARELAGLLGELTAPAVDANAPLPKLRHLAATALVPPARPGDGLVPPAGPGLPAGEEHVRPRASGATSSGATSAGARAAADGPAAGDPARASRTTGTGPSGAGPSGAGPSGAGPSGAGPSGAGPSGAGLSAVGLAGPDDSGTDLFGADLSGADLSGADLSGMTGPTLAGPGAGAPAGPRVRGVRIAAGAVLTVVAVGAALFAWQVAAQFGPDGPTDPIRDARPGTDGPAAAAVPAPAPGELRVQSLTDFDPEGTDRRENPTSTRLATDADAATAWRTSRYSSARLGGLKDGVGLLVDLGTVRSVGAVDLGLVGTGTNVELRSAGLVSDPPRELSGFGLVAEVDGAGADARLRPAAPVATRYLLVWLTELPRDGDWFRGGVRALAVRE